MRLYDWCPRTIASLFLVLGVGPVVYFLLANDKYPTPLAEPKSRSFDFTYATVVKGLAPGQRARIWLPVPSSNEEQDISVLGTNLPAAEQISREPKCGNKILYLEPKGDDHGEIALSLSYRVVRHEVKENVGAKRENPEDLALYLRPDAKVPVEGKPLKLLKGIQIPQDRMAAARVLYDVVNNHMRYSKEGKGWGDGDAVWACDSRYGNCSDFHSLFISLARSQKIPAKFEIGFPLPAERGSGEIAGYHCWAKFYSAGNGWVPVDISEANKEPSMKEYYFGHLTENRVTFSNGRDLNLVPRQSADPINFLIYPHVEVSGSVYSPEKIVRRFYFKDLGQPQ